VLQPLQGSIGHCIRHWTAGRRDKWADKYVPQWE